VEEGSSRWRPSADPSKQRWAGRNFGIQFLGMFPAFNLETSPGPHMLARDEFGAALGEILRDATGDASLIVGSLQRLSSGASRDSWILQCEAKKFAGRRFVLQLFPERRVGTGLAATNEAQLLLAAGLGGVPVPKVVASGGSGGPLESPYLITEWIDGETLPSRLFRDPAYARGLGRLHEDCATALVRVHQLPLHAVDLQVVDPIEPYRKDVAASGQWHPALEWSYRWLDRNRPEGHSPCIVHGDFRLGNLLLDQQGLRAILDWELAHVGDPYEDLAWPLVRAWRFDRVRPAGLFPDRQQWVEAYEAASGVDIDPIALRWWEIAATFKWGVICLTQWLRHRDHLTRSVELAAIGRRVAENEYDLLRLIP